MDLQIIDYKDKHEFISDKGIKSVVYLMDCMEGLKQIPEKYFELAVVDPPYFNGPQKPGYYKGTKQKCDVTKFKDLSKSWDIPNALYFDNLLKVSKNQIIWGINYFNYCLPGGRIVWIKGDAECPFSMADIAYQSFYKRIDTYKYIWSGFWQQKGYKKETRIHPTQKPIALYEWLIKKYAKASDKIIDTHLGSGSSRIAAYNAGLPFMGFELDEDYFKASVKRFEQYINQTKLF